MGKHKGKENRHKERLEELEKYVRKNLEKTGLLANIRIHYGTIDNEENPPYVEFKPLAKKEQIPSDEYDEYAEPRNTVFDALRMDSRCKILRDMLFNILTQNFPEVRGISYRFVSPKDSNKMVMRAVLNLNYQVEITDYGDFTEKVLSTVNKTLESYILRVK